MKIRMIPCEENASMKFTEEKKKAISRYILEKIAEGNPSVTRAVSETLEINQNTVHSYITEMIEDGVITRKKRGEYELVKKTYEHRLIRANGDLDSDMSAYHQFLGEILRNETKNVQGIWEYAFSEMINNVMDHSCASEALIRVIRDSLRTTVILTDNGVGIFRKIREYFNLESLDEAIEELFKGKLTTDSLHHSGEGIFFTSRMMDDFLILSDDKVFCINKYDESTLTDIGMPTAGTLIYMNLSNTSNKTAKEIFDRFSDIDSGFTRTSIPLRNIYDSSPVSRSQARRLSHRLDRFEEVTLDFDGLEWMGQGFAHELFVVFAREHPGIRLLPVSMNDATEKMYRHVLADQ